MDVAAVLIEVGGGNAGGAEHGSVLAQQDRVDLRATAVDGEDGGQPGHGSVSRSATVTKRGAARPEPVDRGADRVGRPSGPRVEQDDGTVAVGAHAFDRVMGDRFAGSGGFPVLEHHVPVHVAVAEALEHAEHPRIVVAGAERTPEPGPGVDAGRCEDRAVAVPHVGGDPLVVQERHACVIEAVKADQVAVVRDRAREFGLRLRPSPLDEERGSNLALSQTRRGSAVARPAGTTAGRGVPRRT